MTGKTIDIEFSEIGVDFGSEVRARHAAGKSMRQTARELGCAMSTVMLWSFRHSLVWPTQAIKGPAACFTFAGIHAHLADHCRLWDVRPQAIINLKKRYGLSNTDAMERQIKRDPAKRRIFLHFQLVLDDEPNAPESLFRRVLAESVLTV